ncbi:MAG: bifunctional protein tyrosine phosphatase family protein/NAD(P)/FAD-dependent oxidoreductase [Gammaproteobacteria bacterium]|nr:bifunctional protein tyrosine phosphatase family protein/NAD(P)/FAD-dependent oxidoreductase [Gammaproteobacteria bacterium]
MNIKKLSPRFFVSEQIAIADLGVASAQGIKTIINNRPDNEAQGQPRSADLAAAAAELGMQFVNLPVIAGRLTDENIDEFERANRSLQGPILMYCRTGTRSTCLWALNEAKTLDVDAVMATAAQAGYDLKAMRARLISRSAATPAAASESIRKAASADEHDVVIVGGGTAGLATASSMLRRKPGLDILLIEPREAHYYQPGWTLVGAGIFDRKKTERAMASVMPDGVKWRHAAVAGFEPEDNNVVLEDGERIGYRVLVAAAGIKLDWDAIEGLGDTLGKNGVTSNYRYDMAPYTWDLVQELKQGRAIFTQPPMPIKCAGAPQKAMYLSCDHWLRQGSLKDITVEFHNAGGALFGVSDYVPALSKYVDKYGIDLCLNENLVAVDGPAGKAWFDRTDGDGKTSRVELDFDMMHVCPVQTAPDFIRQSPLANDAGWVDVSAETLQHSKFGNIFSAGDVCSAPNAKTAAALRKQAPVVAENALKVLSGGTPHAVYDGYGSCPLTVERGKIVLAEFGYGGKHLPSFPQWLINSYEPSRLAWLLKEKMLPGIYWELLLKGREWLVDTELLPQVPASREHKDAVD